MNKRGTYMNNQHAGMTHEEATALAQEMEAFYEAADPFNRTVAFNVIANADGTYGVLASDAQESWTINKAAWEAGRAERAAFLASRREEKEQEAHIQRDRAARLERRRLWFPGEDHAPGWADLLASDEAMAAAAARAAHIHLRDFIERERALGREVPAVVAQSLQFFETYLSKDESNT
jgi:hypothetical protein